MLMSIQFALWSNKSENVKLVQWVVRSFYKSPESVMLIKIYLIVITDQLRTTTSRSDQSHEQKFPDVFRAVECWWGAGGPRPWALPCWGCQVTQVTKISQGSKLIQESRKHTCVTQPFFKSRNLSSHHETPSASSLLMNMSHSHINQMEYQKGCEWRRRVPIWYRSNDKNILVPDCIYVNVCVFILYL